MMILVCGEIVFVGGLIWGRSLLGEGRSGRGYGVVVLLFELLFKLFGGLCVVLECE